MGHKIITEKDFWICTSGAVPAQLQSTQLVTYKQSGEKYITVRDKATSSWIDFGCTKYMLLMALIAAVVVVVAVVCVVGVAATGGAALIAIGALAGLAGGLLGAVAGGLLCGQKMASLREWVVPKSDFKILGADTITGDCTMICPAGGTVKFAPNIKNWWQAIGVGAANYIIKLAESAAVGGMVGMVAPAVVPLFTGGATLAMPTLGSVWANFAGSFGGAFGAMRGLSAVEQLPNKWAAGELNDAGDVGRTMLFGGVPEVEFAHRVATGGSLRPTDALLLLYLLNIKAKTPPESAAPPRDEPTAPREDEPTAPKEEEPNKPKEDETAPPAGERPAESSSGKQGEFEAFEDSPGVKPSDQALIDAVEAEAAKRIAAKQAAIRSGRSTPRNSPCESGVYDPITGETFFGENFPKTAEGARAFEEFKKNASQVVRDRIAAREAAIEQARANGDPIDPKHDPRIGGHSEVVALDKAIKAREAMTGKPVTEADLPSFDLHNRHMPSNTPMDRCPNCAAVTEGVNVIGGHR